MSEDFDKKRALFDKFVEEKGFSGWYETSGGFKVNFKPFLRMSQFLIACCGKYLNPKKAKENININEAATKLIEKVIENESKLAPPRKLFNFFSAAITWFTSNYNVPFQALYTV